jgi:flagellar basal body rod protein FlgF
MKLVDGMGQIKASGENRRRMDKSESGMGRRSRDVQLQATEGPALAHSERVVKGILESSRIALSLTVGAVLALRSM